MLITASMIFISGRGKTEATTSLAGQDTHIPKGLVGVYLTAKCTGDRLTLKDPVEFHRKHTSATIYIEPDLKHQEIEGFGGAFTESAAYALSKVSPEKREEVIKAYFDPLEGLGYSLCRTHINSCDFSLGNYSYVETPDDTELKDFNIQRDKNLLIPLIKDAMAVSGSSFKILASPWSPPAWMKTNGKMNDGGKLKPEYAGTWAQYFIKYIKAYAAEGINIWGVSVQNEPDATQRWDSCRYSAGEERDFVKNHLGPALSKQQLDSVKVIVWDHNKNNIVNRAKDILSDPNAARYIWGTGYHWYRGEYLNDLARLNNMYPDKKLLPTEGCIEDGPKVGEWYTGEKYGRSIIGDLNHYAAGWIDWNMVLDEHGGPNHADNFCDAPVIADGETNRIFYNSSYYYIGHFSKFIRPGAVRIGCKINNSKLRATAFQNTDGKIAVVVMNDSGKRIKFSLGQAGGAAHLTSPAHSIMTLLIAPETVI